MNQMDQSIHELYLLLFDSIPQGIALFDHEINPIMYNSQFLQYCSRFSEKIFKGNIEVPEKIIHKIMEHTRNKDLNYSKSVFSITSSDSTEFHGIVNTVYHRSCVYFKMILHRKKLSDFEFFTSLKHQYKINDKELEIIDYVKRGLTNKEIARLLKVSEASIKMHLYRIYQKWDVSNRTELVGLLEDVTEM